MEPAKAPKGRPMSPHPFWEIDHPRERRVSIGESQRAEMHATLASGDTGHQAKKLGAAAANCMRVPSNGRNMMNIFPQGALLPVMPMMPTMLDRTGVLYGIPVMHGSMMGHNTITRTGMVPMMVPYGGIVPVGAGLAPIMSKGGVRRPGQPGDKKNHGVESRREDAQKVPLSDQESDESNQSVDPIPGVAPRVSEDCESVASDTPSQVERRKRSTLLSFPRKLHQILSQQKYSESISWLPHGRAFRVINQEKFEKEVLPRYYRSVRFQSFMRQINGWGFKRIGQGPDINGYYHELFLRGIPHLVDKMKRENAVKDKVPQGKEHGGDNPDFYKISVYAPLPDPNDIREPIIKSSGDKTTVSVKSIRSPLDSSGSVSSVSLSHCVGESFAFETPSCSKTFKESKTEVQDEVSVALLELKQTPRDSTSPEASIGSHRTDHLSGIESPPDSPPVNRVNAIDTSTEGISSTLEAMITPVSRSVGSAEAKATSADPLPGTAAALDLFPVHAPDTDDHSRSSFFSHPSFVRGMSDALSFGGFAGLPGEPPQLERTESSLSLLSTGAPGGTFDFQSTLAFGAEGSMMNSLCGSADPHRVLVMGQPVPGSTYSMPTTGSLMSHDLVAGSAAGAASFPDASAASGLSAADLAYLAQQNSILLAESQHMNTSNSKWGRGTFGKR